MYCTIYKIPLFFALFFKLLLKCSLWGYYCCIQPIILQANGYGRHSSEPCSSSRFFVFYKQREHNVFLRLVLMDINQILVTLLFNYFQPIIIV